MSLAKSSDRSEDFNRFLAAQDGIGRDILSKDWSKTSIGPIETWPASLRVMLRFVLTTRQPIVFFWGPDLHQFFNASYAPILKGMPPDPIGAPFKSYWREVFEGVRPFFERAMRGEGTWAEDLSLRLTRGGVTRDTYWTFSYSPLFDDEGVIQGFINAVTETTVSVEGRQALAQAIAALEVEHENTLAALASQREAEKRQRVLQRELSHRMKNSLAMVQAIVSQSIRHATSLEEAGQAITARVQALGLAQDLLTRTSWERTNVAVVVDAALAPHRIGDDRIGMAGPVVSIVAEQGLGLALAIHELATNAAKYGALSAERGRVEVMWDIEGERFTFEWREVGAPPSRPPDRKGFGTRLLERIVPGYFTGSGRIDYGAHGVRYVLDGTLRKDAV